MKNSKSWILVCLLFTAFSVSAQFDNKQHAIFKNDYQNVQLSYSKTTSIIFPYAIKSADKGSQDVLVQKAKGVENILLVKAARQNFQQTNLTVVTADGKLFGFILNYDELCPVLNLTMDSSMRLSQEILFSSENENRKEIEQYALLALSKKTRVEGLKASRFEIKLRINGLFIHQDIMYYRIVLGNKSNVNYDIDQLRFFVCDQKISKRTASQEIEITPLLTTSQVSKIPDQSELVVVFAIPKFTIPEKKYLAIELLEKNGERHVSLAIKNTDLQQVQVLHQ
jgi:conjugative transposon TraN protein